jgi:Na+-driven multidrug efflux pump
MIRIVGFLIPAFWLAARPEFQLVQLWYVSVASQALQALVSLWLVRGQFRRILRVRSAAEPVHAATALLTKQAGP